MIRNKKEIFKIVAYLVLAFVFKGSYAQKGLSSETEIPSLCETYKDYFSIGVAISPKKSFDSKAKEVIKKHFNSISAENEMKPSAFMRRKGSYAWSKADEIVNFSKENNIQVRGHTLLWHKQTPDWFFKDDTGANVTPEVLYQRLHVYMKAVMTRYKDEVYVWDVVNEAITDSNKGGVYRTKDSKWFEICGEEFIGKAFEIAHSINPDVQLFYNDYNLIKPKKQNRAYSMLKKLIDRGVPIDGVGLQAHWYIEDTPEMVEKAINRFASLGLKIQITELDVSFFNYKDKNVTKDFNFTKKASKKQAKRYASFFNVFVKYSHIIDNVTLWGLSDKDSWLNNHPVKGRRNYPLLFDDTYRPKEAFYGITKDMK